MQNKIVIELLEAGTNKFKTYVFEKDKINIGRSYNSDLILNDKFIDKDHLEISVNTSDDNLNIYDLSSKNGTFINQKKLSNDFKGVESGSTLKIGKTKLRVFLGTHTVEETKLFSFGTKIHDALDNVTFAVMSLTVLLLLSLMTDVESNNPSRYFSDNDYWETLYIVAMVALGIAIINKFAASYNSSKKSFALSLSFTSISLIIFLLFYADILPYIHFLSSTHAEKITYETILLTMFITATTLTWSYINNEKLFSKLNILGFIAFMAIIVIISTIETTSFSTAPKYPTRLLETPISKERLVSVDTFLENSEDLFKELKDDN